MESLKATIETVPERVLQVMNELLKKEEFPKPLKRSQTSTKKKSGDSGNEKKERSLCLLNTFGKLLEPLIRKKVNKTLEEKYQ